MQIYNCNPSAQRLGSNPDPRLNEDELFAHPRFEFHRLKHDSDALLTLNLGARIEETSCKCGL